MRTSDGPAPPLPVEVPESPARSHPRTAASATSGTKRNKQRVITAPTYSFPSGKQGIQRAAGAAGAAGSALNRVIVSEYARRPRLEKHLVRRLQFQLARPLPRQRGLDRLPRVVAGHLHVDERPGEADVLHPRGDRI